ncbi:transcription termination/antitermination protein NusA [bacterium]|nr:transcription termination/antitermination protein NusA [bacterium]
MSGEIANYQIVEALTDLVKDKGLSQEDVIETLKHALLVAVRKRYGTTDNVEIEINPETGFLKIVAKKKVVTKVSDPATEIAKSEAKKTNPDVRVGDIVEVELNPADFGRNAILSAKQSLLQKIRETEREIIYNDFRHKQNEIISGVVSRVERGNIIVNVGRTEAILPRSEQIPDEHLPIGKTIRAYVKEVKRDSRGPQIVLSRRAPEFVKKLFEFEVPEVYEGRVQIYSVARAAGERTKIAVYSTDDRIDPVGACVGLKGTRVQAVVKELSNEKIDIIPFSPDPEEFIKRALAPAEVLETYIQPEEHKIVVIVPDDQLSVAIGKGGINARLAARLVKWRLTIFGEQQYKSSLIPIEELDILTPEQIEGLKKFEIDTVQKLVRMKRELLQSIPEIGDDAEKILLEARKKIDEVEAEKAFVTKDRLLEDIIGGEGSKKAKPFANIESPQGGEQSDEEK